MANTRVKDLIEQIKNTTDPDMLQILKFDLAEAMGRKDAGVKKPPVRKRSGGGSEMTDKQKKFAALAEPRDKITYAHKLAGAGVKRASGGGQGQGSFGGDEVLAAGRSRGGRKAIRGTKFSGLF